jgi:NAD(P)-dependent dehydrogenase (short-subunit alcohol dehydrogenase family)
MSVDGPVAIVTGGGSGIGAAAGAALVARGARVALVDVDVAAAEAVAGGLGGAAIAIAADVSREEDIERYTQTTLEAFGRVDMVHLNAAISGTFAPFPQITTEEFDRVIAVNLRSVFIGLREALATFAAQGGGGTIVATASLAGLHGGEALIPYTAAKHGVIGLVKCAAAHGARIGVRVNAIAPGIIETGLMGDLRSALGEDVEAVLEGLRAAIPLGRFGASEEAGALVAFLLGEESSYLTGTVIPIDGGVMAANPLNAQRSGPSAHAEFSDEL